MRLKNRYVAVLAVLTLFIVGCSHNLVGRMSGDGNAESTVTFSVTDIPPNYAKMIQQAQNPASRSIYPHNPYTLGTSGLTFILTGTSNAGDSLSETITLTGSGPYTFTKPLGAYVWDLTLTTYKGPATDNIKVLVGHCTIDLTTTNGTATFKMSTKGLTTPGTVKISGTVKDPDSLCTYYEMGICNAYSGKLITEYTPVGASTPTTVDTVKTESSITHSGTPVTFDFSYEKSPAVTLNAGVYDYRMVFYKGTPGNYTIIGSWGDVLIVNPGHDLVENVGEIDPLNKKPEPPSNLRAYLVNNSEDTEGRYFYTKLTWDKGKYETNYELRLTPYSGDPLTAGTPVIYGFKSTYTTPPANLEEFVTSDIYHSGNLIYGSEECTLKLELGKVYDVEIRAHNYLGEAPATPTWVTRETSGGTTPPNCVLFDGTMGPHISRYRITYNLNGGELILNGQPTNKPIQGTYSEYHSYTGAAVSLMTIDSTPSPLPPTATGNYLTRGAVAFTGWGKIPSAPPYTPTPLTTYNGYENIIATASYGHSFNGTVDLETLTEMDAGNIVFEYGDSNLTPLTPVTPDSSLNVSIPKKTGTPLQNTWVKISFTTPAIPATEEYSNMQCTLYLGNGMYINKFDILSAADGKSCVFSTQEYIPQKITLQIKATNKAHQIVGKTFYINLY